MDRIKKYLVSPPGGGDVLQSRTEGVKTKYYG